MAKDYYAVLGLKRDASDKEVRQAFRRLARKHHPDVNPGDASAESKFKEINEAYEVLSDPEKRKKYDQFGEKWQYADQFAKAGRTEPFRRRSWSSSTDDLGFGGDPFQEVFESIFRERPSQRSRSRSQGEDIAHPVEVTLEEAYTGTALLLTLTRQEPCSACAGSGISSRGFERKACPLCQGRGSRPQPKRLEVKIPPGVKDGSRIRIAGEGAPGLMGNHRGDLYLEVSMKKHERFRREGDDLYVDVPVSLADALLGGEVAVDTLNGGNLYLKVPPETQNGRTFRLSGKGMPRLGSEERGDLYAQVKVVLPEHLSPRERGLIEELRALRKVGKG